MQTHFSCLLLLLSLTLSAQEKGISPLNSSTSQPLNSSTYAVVVGISDYQHPDIPDLRFADKDAEAFAAFLQSPAGGSLDEDHLKVLINEDATAGKVAADLYWLMDECKEGDRAIIYFSGHGDAEDRFKRQPGFLLCWDAPEQVYLAGGVIDLRLLQDVISALSLDNKAKVVVVTDACRAGKLSGSTLDGTQTTAANLQKQYANEIKILSCQPDEYSIEGEQWGGGRGAFSYHLLDGLTGMADGNADNTVDLKEIGRYLEDNVTEEVAPQNQNPMIIGNKTEKLTDVFPEILEQLKEGKRGQLQLFTHTESRGIEEEVLAAADSNVVQMYFAFREAIEQKEFLSPENACAEFYYSKLSQEPQLKKLHSSIRRNYAAALQDDAQQVMNRLLDSHPLEVNKTFYAKNKNYGNYPQLLRRAAELLGEEHYMYRPLMARSYWFEGYVNDRSLCYCTNEANSRTVLPLYGKALEYQPEMPHAWLQMAIVYGIQLNRKDSLDYYANLTIDAVPEWTSAYYWAGYCYSSFHWNSGEMTDFLNSKRWLKKGLAIDSNSVLLLNELGDLLTRTGEFEKAQKILARAIEITPTAQTLEFLGWNYFDYGNFDKAEEVYLQAIDLDPTFMTQLAPRLSRLYGILNQENKIDSFWNTYSAMFPPEAYMYKEFCRGYLRYFPRKALSCLQTSVRMDPTDAQTLNLLAVTHSYLEDGDEAEELECTMKALSLAPQSPLFANNVASIYLRKNMIDSTEKYTRIALKSADYGLANGVLSMLYFQNGLLEKAAGQLQMGMEKNAQKLLRDLAHRARRYIMDPGLTMDYFRFIEKMYPDNPLVNIAIAGDMVLFQKDKDGAFKELEKSIQKGLSDKSSLIYGSHIPLKLERKRWNELVKERFPELIIED